MTSLKYRLRKDKLLEYSSSNTVFPGIWFSGKGRIRAGVSDRYQWIWNVSGMFLIQIYSLLLRIHCLYLLPYKFQRG